MAKSDNEIYYIELCKWSLVKKKKKKNHEKYDRKSHENCNSFENRCHNSFKLMIRRRGSFNHEQNQQIINEQTKI